MPIFPGSKITTDSGALPVDLLPAGSPVLTRSGLVPAGQPASQRVSGCFTILTLSSNRQLIATSDQQVMVINRGASRAESRGWVAARDVFSGDRVFTVSGPQTVIRLNYWRGVETVYSLPAAECYVEGVLVSDGNG